MRKTENQIIQAIKITKKYSPEEIKKLGWLFTYLNNINIEEEEFKTWISAKWLWKLLDPQTRTWKTQKFDDWWQSVSNTARLKEDEDYEKIESIEKIKNEKGTFDLSENSETSKVPLNKGRWWSRGNYWIKQIDYILTLRAWEYCAVLTKWDSWDLYRKFIFDIKDEFIRLVFRFWKSIESRTKFTKSIWNLDWMKSQEKKWGVIYWEMTKLLYLTIYGVKASEFKSQNHLPKKEIARHYFTKDGLFNLEELENDLWVIIKYEKPKDRDALKELIQNFLKEKENDY